MALENVKTHINTRFLIELENMQQFKQYFKKYKR